MKTYLTLLLLILISDTLIGQSVTDDPEARKIFEEVDERRSKIKTEKADMRMVIFDPKGNTRERSIQSYSFNANDISKSLLIFEEPANVRGTGFLSVSKGTNEVQKLYLPALGQIQIISAAEKGDRFMGSDFTYEDLSDQDPQHYTFQMHAKSDSAYVLKARKKGSSQYDYIYFHVHPDRYVLQKAEYFNDEGTMIKQLVASEYEEVMEEVWQPAKMVMFDLRNDRKTELSWSNRQINTSIPEWRFTERGLRRGL